MSRNNNIARFGVNRSESFDVDELFPSYDIATPMEPCAPVNSPSNALEDDDDYAMDLDHRTPYNTPVTGSVSGDNFSINGNAIPITYDNSNQMKMSTSPARAAGFQRVRGELHQNWSFANAERLSDEESVCSTPTDTTDDLAVIPSTDTNEACERGGAQHSRDDSPNSVRAVCPRSRYAGKVSALRPAPITCNPKYVFGSMDMGPTPIHRNGPFATCPPEIINKVFSYLDVKSDVKSLMKTAEKFRSIGTPYLFKGEVHLVHRTDPDRHGGWCGIHSLSLLLSNRPEAADYIAKVEKLFISGTLNNGFGCFVWHRLPVTNIRDLYLHIHKTDPALATLLHQRLDGFGREIRSGTEWENLWVAILSVLFHKVTEVSIKSRDPPLDANRRAYHADILRGFLVPPEVDGRSFFSLKEYHITKLTLTNEVSGEVIRHMFDAPPGFSFPYLRMLEVSHAGMFFFEEPAMPIRLKHLRLTLSVANDFLLPQFLHSFTGLQAFEMFLCDDSYPWNFISGVLQMHDQTLRMLNFDQYHRDSLFQTPGVITGPVVELEHLEVYVGTAESILMNPDRDRHDFKDELFPRSITTIILSHISILDGLVLRFVREHIDDLPNLKWIVLDWKNHALKATESDDMTFFHRRGVTVITNGKWPESIQARFGRGFNRVSMADFF